MQKITIYSFLRSFINIFGASINFFDLKSNDHVIGQFTWLDEDEKQDFLWKIDYPDESIYLDIIYLCDFLKNNNLLRGDKVVITEQELIAKLEESKWSFNNIQSTIDYLFDIEVLMVDGIDDSHPLYLHF